MIYRRGDKVLHIRYPEWGVGIVKGDKSPGILVEFQPTMFGKCHRWICAAGHLTKVNGWRREEIEGLSVVHAELLKQKRIAAASREEDGEEA